MVVLESHVDLRSRVGQGEAQGGGEGGGELPLLLLVVIEALEETVIPPVLSCLPACLPASQPARRHPSIPVLPGQPHLRVTVLLRPALDPLVSVARVWTCLAQTETLGGMRSMFLVLEITWLCCLLALGMTVLWTMLRNRPERNCMKDEISDLFYRWRDPRPPG